MIVERCEEMLGNVRSQEEMKGNVSNWSYLEDYGVCWRNMEKQGEKVKNTLFLYYGV